MGERLKGIVIGELDGKTGKKAWVRVDVRRRAKGGRYRYVNGMLRLSQEKGLKPRKVQIDKPVTVFVKEASAFFFRLADGIATQHQFMPHANQRVVLAVPNLWMSWWAPRGLWSLVAICLESLSLVFSMSTFTFSVSIEWLA